MTQAQAKELYHAISRVKNYEQFERILNDYVQIVKIFELTLDLEEMQVLLEALDCADEELRRSPEGLKYTVLRSKLHDITLSC